MAWGPGETPKFIRKPITTIEVQREYEKYPYKSFECFINFLDTLDWNKTAIFWEENRHSHSGNQGYRVVHFQEKVEEKWHDAWGQTWFGLSSWMS